MTSQEHAQAIAKVVWTSSTLRTTTHMIKVAIDEAEVRGYERAMEDMRTRAAGTSYQHKGVWVVPWATIWPGMKPEA